MGEIQGHYQIMVFSDFGRFKEPHTLHNFGSSVKSTSNGCVLNLIFVSIVANRGP